MLGKIKKVLAWIGGLGFLAGLAALFLKLRKTESEPQVVKAEIKIENPQKEKDVEEANRISDNVDYFRGK